MGAMFLTPNKEARECRLHAEHCEDKARLQSDPQFRQDFLEMQQRWWSLARSYEFLERLELLSAVEAKIIRRAPDNQGRGLAEN
jgi:hypothetical protein